MNNQNLIPFDLEKSKSGEPIITRDGIVRGLPFPSPMERWVRREWWEFEQQKNAQRNLVTAENERLRGAMARLCRAVCQRMIPDDPTPEDRMELRESYDAAVHLLEPNAQGELPTERK